MSYRPETILRRRDPQENSYDEIRVIGQALTSHSGPTMSGWEGSNADVWTVAPTSFGPVLDKPEGELQRDYEVISEPDLKPAEVKAQAEQPGPPGPSAEETFKKNAGKPAGKRVATPLATQIDEEPTTLTTTKTAKS